MKDYAYLDKFGYLHINDKYEKALGNSRNGKIIETEIPNEKGYPITDEGEPITARVTYGEGSYEIDIDIRGGFPEIIALIEQLA